jgi:uncharacterized protein with GYD domain
MARFLLLASYSPEGAKGVMASGMAGRREAVSAAFTAMGGSLVSMDVVSGGEWDFAIVCDLPGSASVKALTMATNSSGGFRSAEILELVPVEAFDAALPEELGGYRPPNA